MGGTARALTGQTARATAAGERGKSTKGWHHGGRTGNLWEN